jgi:hypothetical protein
VCRNIDVETAEVQRDGDIGEAMTNGTHLMQHMGCSKRADESDDVVAQDIKKTTWRRTIFLDLKKR